MRVAFVSTYPPTRCGLATFTQALVRSLQIAGVRPQVLRVLAKGGSNAALPEVIASMNPSLPDQVVGAARKLSTFDVVVVEHEFGIYGPDSGRAVLDLVERVRGPRLVVTLHTVLRKPTERQRGIIEWLVDRNDATVVASHSAEQRLLDSYVVDPGKVVVIPHGAHKVGSAPSSANGGILTFGLLGPGKGIEWAIEALALLRQAGMRPTYVIAGETHPNVQEQEGESYRRSLRRLASELGVAEQLRFINRYLDRSDLDRLIEESEVVLLPYDNDQQVTSGPLTEAIAAGRPVVATRFPHAEELLEGGAGIVVSQRDPMEIASALGRLLSSSTAYQEAARAAAAKGRYLGWPAVAGRYLELLEERPARMAASVA